MSSRGFYHSDRPQNGNKRKQKERRILGPRARSEYLPLWKIKIKGDMKVIKIVDDALTTIPLGLAKGLEEL